MLAELIWIRCECRLQRRTIRAQDFCAFRFGDRQFLRDLQSVDRARCRVKECADLIRSRTKHPCEIVWRSCERRMHAREIVRRKNRTCFAEPELTLEPTA